MSEKNKNGNRKKLITSIALVITIGIATIIPLAFFMSGTNTVKAQQSVTDSLFNIDIPCAYYNADVTYNVEINSMIDGRHSVFDAWYRDAAVIAVQPSINYDALDNDTVARIEYFEYTVYTDNLQLQKSYSYFAFNEKAFDQYNDGPSAYFAMNYYTENMRSHLRDGDYFGGFSVTDPEDPMIVWVAGNHANRGYGADETIDETYRNILAEVESTQTIYLDIRRVAYVSISVDGTMMVVEDNKIIQHLELTKNDEGFMFGTPADIPVEVYSGRQREYYFGLPTIPYKGTDVPEELWSTVWPDIFGE
ncbi:MAG: hypothetical protein LBB87_04070 [Nitrososphaerota archaeon]|nr:hypothetical protein [Nitrososphaerota archaeon]